MFTLFVQNIRLHKQVENPLSYITTLCNFQHPSTIAIIMYASTTQQSDTHTHPSCWCFRQYFTLQSMVTHNACKLFVHLFAWYFGDNIDKSCIWATLPSRFACFNTSCIYLVETLNFRSCDFILWSLLLVSELTGCFCCRSSFYVIKNTCAQVFTTNLFELCLLLCCHYCVTSRRPVVPSLYTVSCIYLHGINQFSVVSRVISYLVTKISFF